MRRFTMYRRNVPDATHNAFQKNAPDQPQFEGVVWTDGTCAIRWMTAKGSTAIWNCFDVSVVRYGNVVGSRGSVIPLFKRLALEGKALPITDKRMTRFWITLDQAIDLVLLCQHEMIGREIVVPKIPSMKIVDLARAISSDWLETGIRPGEKIHEVLITEDEARHAMEYLDSYKIWPNNIKGTMPEGFRYTSDGNDDWLTVEQLRDMIK